MENSFFCQWFQGFEKGLDEIDPESRSCLLKNCAKRCADTGVVQAYRQLHQAVNGDRDAFYRRLHETGAVHGEIVVPDKEYIICFPECACDLHMEFGVTTANLCECSRQSILYVAQRIWNTENIRVEQIGTVLSGDADCRFRVIFD